MKKLISTALLLSMIAICLIATPALAWWPGGDADASVEIEVLQDPGPARTTGEWVTASGTVTVTSDTWSDEWWSYAESYARAGYEVLNPDGVVIDADSVENYDVDTWYATTDASLVFPWTTTFNLNDDGDWIIAIEGEALAELMGWFVSDSDYDYLLQLLTVTACPASPGAGAEYDGEFLVIIQTWAQRQGYSYVEGWPNGRTLKKGVDQVGRVDTSNYHRIYRIVIPEGTEVSAGNSRVAVLKLDVLNEQVVFSPSFVEFSNTCHLYIHDGEDVVIEFNKIVNGQPVME